MPRRPDQNTRRVVALTLAFFGGLAALAQANGIFARLGPDLTLTLAIFAAAFAVLTYHLDPEVRAFVRRLVAPRANLAKQGRDPAATMW
jgi:hypothetical protein